MTAAFARTLAAIAAATAFATALAQPASAPTDALPYKTVADALAALQARDGQDTVVTQADGWTTVNEPAASAQWSFPPKGHPAYPAALRRVIVRGPNNAVSVRTQSLCEAPAEACAKLVAEFESTNERIVQALKARGGGAPRQR
jgi:hypothetical protein